MEAPSTPAPAAPTMGAVARLFGAFFSPVKTFRSIATRPTWLLPILVWTVVSLAIAAVVIPRIDWEKMTRTRLEKSGQTIPQERLTEIVERQKRIGPVFYNIFAVIGPWIAALVVAGVFLGAFKAFGSDLTFRQSFAVTNHALLPGVLGALLLAPVLLRQEAIDPQQVGDLLHSNLGFLVETSSKALHSLAQSLDIFTIWSIVLLTIGYAEAGRTTRGRAAGIVVTLWILYALGKAGIAVAFG